MELKSVSTEFEIKSDGRTIEGYASTFGGPPDSYGDIIVQGAFTKTIAESGPPKSGIIMLWRHDEPIGMPTKLAEDSKGLQFEASILDTQQGNDALKLIRAKVVKKMSIGFRSIKEDYSRENGEMVRYLREIQLKEISPVVFPANDNAVITGVKSLIISAARVEEEIKQLQKSDPKSRVLTEVGERIQSILNALGKEPLSGTLQNAEPQIKAQEPPTGTLSENEMKALITELEKIQIAAVLDRL